MIQLSPVKEPTAVNQTFIRRRSIDLKNDGIIVASAGFPSHYVYYITNQIYAFYPEGEEVIASLILAAEVFASCPI